MESNNNEGDAGLDELRGWLVEMPTVRSCVVCGLATKYLDAELGLSLCRGHCTTRKRVEGWVEEARSTV